MHCIQLIIILQALVISLGDSQQQQQCDKDNHCESETVSEVNKYKSFKQQRTERMKNMNNLPPLNDHLYLLEDNELPQVLWWYNIYPYAEKSKTIECKLGSCMVSNDRRELYSPLTRGIILYGSSIEGETLPLPRLPHHEWALIHEESPSNNWMLSDPLGISLFNHTATFRRESDYPITTFAMDDPQAYFDEEFYVTTTEKNRLQREEGLATAVFVQGNCHTSSDRDSYISELMKYLPIDSYGKCLNNKQMPDDIDGFLKLRSKPFYYFLAKYKFQIAFENAVCQDYMTEKFVRPLKIGSVPIYYGSPKAQDFAPSNKSVIMVQDFKSPKELAEYILMLNENDELYEEYLKHRLVDKKITNPEFKKTLERQPWKIEHRAHKVNFGSKMLQGFSCHVCDQVYQRNTMLKEHLKNPKNPIKPLKMGKTEHMGCPMPFPILPSIPNHSYKETIRMSRIEVLAYIKMLNANETDTLLYKKKYLN